MSNVSQFTQTEIKDTIYNNENNVNNIINDKNDNKQIQQPTNHIKNDSFML